MGISNGYIMAISTPINGMDWWIWWSSPMGSPLFRQRQLRSWLFQFFLKPQVLLRQVSIFLEWNMVFMANFGYPSIYGWELLRNIT